MRRILAVVVVVLVWAGCAVEAQPDPAGPDAGAEPEPDPAACAGPTPFMGTCTAGDECATCVCFTYGMGEMRCTQECASDADCPAPSSGCNGMGMCKRPDG